MPIFWKSKILLGEIESVYATDPTPAGADNAILATNVQLQPMEGQDVNRELDLPWLAAQATIAAGLHTRLSFRVELVPSGTAGVAPAWGPLLRACGVGQTIVAETSVAYNPVSTNHASVTFHMWVGGTRYVMTGSRGNCTMRFDAQGIAYLEYEFLGLFSLPSEQARPTPTLTGFKTPKVVSAATMPTFEVDGVALVLRRFSLGLGNDVQPRFLANQDSVIIADKAETIECQVEAVPLSTFDPYALAEDPEERVSVELVHRQDAGSIVTLEIDTAQMQRPASLAVEQNIVEWPLRMVPLPTAGNDQWVMTLT